MKITGIIPARYNSSRFPGKPLVNIHGKTMIRRVYEQAVQSTALDKVIVATDDQRIFNEVKSFGGNAVMTSPEHKNGTERCAEVATGLQTDVIINIQGDEPFINPLQINKLANCFVGPEVQIATLVKAHPLNEELQNPSRIKVVMNKHMEALYFSRSLIPFLSQQTKMKIHGLGHEDENHSSSIHHTSLPVFYKHIGIYGYRKDVLLEIVKLNPTALELAESLEQLRWLENGYRIKCAVTDIDAISIDTPEDMELAKHYAR